MRDKIFIDTNIFVYSALEDKEERIKHEKAIDFLEKMEEADECSKLYSEDMQHNQLLENKLRITNPFFCTGYEPDREEIL